MCLLWLSIDLATLSLDTRMDAYRCKLGEQIESHMF